MGLETADDEAPEFDRTIFFGGSVAALMLTDLDLNRGVPGVPTFAGDAASCCFKIDPTELDC